MTDKKLISKYKEGNRQAFNELHDRYRQRLKWFLFGILKNREDAEDVTQNTLIRLIKYNYSYRPSKSKFNTWLFNIAKNSALDFIRDRDDRTDSFDSPELEERQFANDTPAPDKRIIDSQSTDSILNGIPHRQTILLYAQGYKYREIAQILNISINTVKTRIHRARRSL